MQDIIIIGAGVVGCAVARELSRYNANILVLEKGNDVSVGATKANSGIVHAGFDAATGTLKAHYNVLGNKMFDSLSKDLDFPFIRNGALVLCFNKNEQCKLHELLQRGKANGVDGLEILTGEQVRQKEPNVSDSVVSALYAPSSGIVSPYEMAIAYAENAYANGVNFLFNSQVTNVSKSGDVFTVTIKSGETFTAKAVVNCAGVYSDEINNFVSANKLKIIARKGDYHLLDKQCGGLVQRTLFQLPTEKGKGVLVTPTVHGNVLAGPTATDVDDKQNTSTSAEELAYVLQTACQSVTNFPKRNIITQFSGLRAHLTTGDFVVGECDDVPGFFNLAGIESPGLTSAPALACDVAQNVAKRLSLAENANFVGVRKGIAHFNELSDDEKQKLVAQNPLYGKIVCRCENVTEGEIVDAITRPLGARDVDGVKRRTRAGMGRCQAGFCTTRVAELLAEKLGVNLDKVTKCGGASQLVKGKTK